MKLLSFDEIKDGLDREYLPLEPLLEGFRLKTPGLEEHSLHKCESNLNIVLPKDFRRIISLYDFGNLTIGPISFCVAGNYASQLVEYNKEVTWWGNGLRPVNLIMIANSDPYAIVLNTMNGKVVALDPELGLEKATKVSGSSETFIRGIGSIFLLRNNVDDRILLAKYIKEAVDGDDIKFWKFLAN